MALQTLSIIVPIFNVAPYLGQCLDSLLAQRLDVYGFDYEVLLINDGSTDNSRSIAQSYVTAHPTVFALYDKPNGGLSSARNYGLELARGEYVFMPDADDWLVANSLGPLLSLAQASGADLVGANCNNYYDQQTIRPNPKFTPTHSHGMRGSDYLQQTLGKRQGFAPAVWLNLYRKDTICRPFVERRYISEDLIFNIEFLLNAEKVIYLERPIYNYRKKRPGSLTNSASPEITAQKIKGMIYFSQYLRATSQRPAVSSALGNVLRRKGNRQLYRALKWSSKRNGSLNSQLTAQILGELKRNLINDYGLTAHALYMAIKLRSQLSAR